MADQKRATELVNEIGNALVQDRTYREFPWQSLSIVAIVDAGVVQMSGYLYDDKGEPTAKNPDDADLYDKFEELCEAMEQPTGRLWKTALVQIRREGGEAKIQFDYDDAMRWKVTPLNVGTMPEELRPK